MHSYVDCGCHADFHQPYIATVATGDLADVHCLKPIFALQGQGMNI